MNHARPPFDNPKVREALDYMIDKETLVQGALWGQGVVTASPSFPTSPSYAEDLSVRPQDFDKARALLEEAGSGEGELSFVFKVMTNYPWHVEATQILQEWFRQGGVNVEVQQLTWSDWLSQCWVDRDYEVTMMNFFTLWEPDFLYYSLWHSTGAFNYRNVADPEIDRLAEEARRVTDRRAGADLSGRAGPRAGTDPRRRPVVPQRHGRGAAERRRPRPAGASQWLQLGYLFGSIIVIESLFNYTGMGWLTYQALLNRDVPLLQATIIVIAAVVMLANLLVDLGYAALDPRIRAT